MKSQGPPLTKTKTSPSAYAALAKDAVENPHEWFELEIQGVTSGTTNRIAYSLAKLLCDIVQREGVVYVRYNGGDVRPD
jgi:hypothetical protein